MQKYICYLSENFAHHPNLAIIISTLECLEYIEENIHTIAQQVGKSQLLRHPTNHLAFHLSGYRSAKEATDVLLKLAHEVRGRFEQLVTIEDLKHRTAQLNTFLLNINDSDVGCMEARLRPALLSCALQDNNGCPTLDELMHQFYASCKSNQGACVEEIIDFFADKVEHQLPVYTEMHEIQPLSWCLVKNYLKTTMACDEIEKDWSLYSKKLKQQINSKQLQIVQTPHWFFHNFTIQNKASRYLSYVKSVLPEFKNELAKADVQFNQERRVYFFRLSYEQYVAFNSLQEQALVEQEGIQVDFDRLFPKTTWVSLSNNEKKCQLHFDSQDRAQESLEAFKKLLTIKEGKKAPKVKQNSPNSFSFFLTNQQWVLLRQVVRKSAHQNKPTVDFVIKSIRTDEFNYFRRFIQMITEPNVKYPLRQKSKKTYTVTGKGVFKRAQITPDEPINSSVPIKQPQYTAGQKAGFSKAQSATLGLPDFYPRVFRFNKQNKLVGVLFLDLDENTLLSDRSYIYDSGTVARPYDFYDYQQAENYYRDKVGNSLFSKDQFTEFKAAIKVNPKLYNEMLVRLHWTTNKNSQIFIGSDTLSARLWAQDYARVLKKYLLDNHLCDENYIIPICFYIPQDPHLNFRKYTIDEQRLDGLNARAIYFNKQLRQQKYKKVDYEILLALSSEELIKVFQEDRIMLTILSQGHFHLIDSLIEKITSTSAMTEQQLWQLLIQNLLTLKKKDLFMEILFKAINCNQDSAKKFTKLLSQFFDNTIDVNYQLYKIGFYTALQWAAHAGCIDVVNQLLSNNKINVNKSSYDVIERIYFIALVIVLVLMFLPILLAFQIVYHSRLWQPTLSAASTPLHGAVFNNHLEVTTTLLNHPQINVNCKDSHGFTALHLAVFYKNNEAMVQKFLCHEHINVNAKNKLGHTSLQLAITLGQFKIATQLLQHEKIDLDKMSKKNGEFLQKLIQKPEHFDFMAKFFNDYLVSYQIKRAGEGNYHHVYSRFFGVHKNQKLLAVQALLGRRYSLDELANQYKEALSEGELGRVYSLLKTLFKGKEYRTQIPVANIALFAENDDSTQSLPLT